METCRWIHGHTVPETTPSNKNCVRWDIHVIKVEWNIRVLNLMPWYGTLLCKSLKPPLFSLSFVREMGATIYWNVHIVDEEKPICTILFLSFFSGMFLLRWQCVWDHAENDAIWKALNIGSKSVLFCVYNSSMLTRSPTPLAQMEPQTNDRASSVF